MDRKPSVLADSTSQRRIAVALPASLTKDIPHLREKTARAGMIGRTLAIFGVDQIVIYRDHSSARVWDEAALLEKILRFQETPQYLRRHLFKIDPDLQYAGTLPPLRIPSHPDRTEPQINQIREAIVLSQGPVSMLDAGFRQPIVVRKRLTLNQRITVRVTKTAPELEGEAIDSHRLPIYWGFKVRREDASLAELVRKMGQDLTIGTSRDGASIRDVMESFTPEWNASQRPLLLFGSPERGIEEMLANNGKKVDDVTDFNLNMVPEQNVETVRTEEALMISLSILNMLGAN